MVAHLGHILAGERKRIKQLVIKLIAHLGAHSVDDRIIVADYVMPNEDCVARELEKVGDDLFNDWCVCYRLIVNMVHLYDFLGDMYRRLDKGVESLPRKYVRWP